MSGHLEEFWRWARTAPLPVVLALMFALAGWVYTLDVDQRVGAANTVSLSKQVDSMDTKLDKLLDGVADVKAEQRSIRRELQLAPVASAKEKP